MQSIVTQIFNTWGAGPIDQSCLAAAVPPDFDGALPETQSLSTTAFGVPDLWNSGGMRDAPAATCTSCQSCSDKYGNIEIAVFTVLVLVIVIFFTGVYLIVGGRRSESVPM